MKGAKWEVCKKAQADQSPNLPDSLHVGNFQNQRSNTANLVRDLSTEWFQGVSPGIAG